LLTGLNGTIASKPVTYDFARLMDGATEICARSSATTWSRTC